MKHSIQSIFCMVGFLTVSPVAIASPGDYEAVTLVLKVLNDPALGPDATVEFGFETSLTDIDDWEWHLGQGLPQYVPQPLHTYTEAGSFDVSLTVHSPTQGFYTVVEENFVQVNEEIIQDDFENLSFSHLMWEHFDSDLLVDGALQIDTVPVETVGEPRGGQQNGRVICLPVGGGGLATETKAGGRFRFSVELIDNGLATGVEFAVIRLWAPDTLMTAPNQYLAELSIRKNVGFFEARIAGTTSETPWVVLGGGAYQPRIDVQLDWFLKPTSTEVVKEGVLEVRLSDPILMAGHRTLRLDKLNYEINQGLGAVQFGVIDITGHGLDSSGMMRVDSFGAWDYQYLPNLD